MNNLLSVIGISDCHLQPMEKILKGKEADLLVIAGDMTFTGSLREMTQFKKDLLGVRKQFRWVSISLGNHERELDPARGFYNGLNYMQEMAQDVGFDFLHNSGVTYTKNGRDIKVWGSPFTPTFFDWGFLKDRGEPIAQVWKQIPEGLDLLVTHGPPADCMSTLPWSGEDVGCQDLRDRLDNMVGSPKVAIHGHLHFSGGKHIRKPTNTGTFIDYYNVAICDEGYKPLNTVTSFFL